MYFTANLLENLTEFSERIGSNRIMAMSLVCSFLAHPIHRQRRRVRRQVQQGDVGVPVDGERPRADLLRPARHQARPAAARPRTLPLVRQLIRAQPHAHLQPPTPRTYQALDACFPCNVVVSTSLSKGAESLR